MIQVVLPSVEKEEEKRIRLSDKSRMARKLANKEFVKSVEILPPRGHDPSKTVEIAIRLERQGIDCVNIPDGPRASARMSAMAIAFILSSKVKIEPILHYTCRDRNLLGMQSDPFLASMLKG